MTWRILIVAFLFAFGTLVVNSNIPDVQHSVVSVVMDDGGGGDPPMVPPPTTDPVIVADGAGGNPDIA